MSRIHLTVLMLAAVSMPAAAECIRISSIRDFDALDDQNLIIDSGGRDYHVRVAACLGLEHEVRIGFLDGDRDRRLCDGPFDDIVVDNIGAGRCSILSIDGIDEAKAAELRRRYGKPAEGVEGVIEETMPEQETESEPESDEDEAGDQPPGEDEQDAAAPEPQ